MRLKHRGIMLVGAIALSTGLTVGLSEPGVAGKIEDATVPRNVENAEPTALPPEQDFEYGWVGILGLAGLLGVRRLRRAARDHA